MINNNFKFQELIKQELIEAELKYPDYHSFHEGYAVLKEEVEELQEGIDYLTHKLNAYWKDIRNNAVKHDDIEYMKKAIINIIQESIQIGSILERHDRLFKK